MTESRPVEADVHGFWLDRLHRPRREAVARGFGSFFRGATAGRFPRLEDHADLWRL